MADDTERRTGMVLGRHVGQSVTIGEGDNAVIVAVHEIRGTNSVRLHFAAPKSVRILRTELLTRKRDQETEGGCNGA